jgi:hypothetical protein
MKDAIPRSIGTILVFGAVFFWIGACTPPYRQWTGVPMDEYLRIVGEHRLGWYTIHAFFVVGTTLTLAGLACLAVTLNARSESIKPTLGLVLFSLAAVLWLIQVGFRVSVTVWASSELARTSQVPSVYLGLHQWMSVLFGAFMAMSYASLATYGWALLDVPSVARWAKGVMLVFGVLGIPGLATLVFQPPLMVFVAPFLLGVSVVRSRR